MRKRLYFIIVILGIAGINFLSYGCSSTMEIIPNKSYNPQATVCIHSDEVINDSYIGNGAQWDPYQQNYGNVELKISESDWQKLYARLDFMRPQFMRVMINTNSLIFNGKLVPEHTIERLTPILDYCQSRNVCVMFGDWGNGLVDSETNSINETKLSLAAQYADYLIHTKGYSCIKYYNLIGIGG
ncbi:MAG: hypothetical protein NTY32_01630 [Bacteroidia bacterium]|nr:hypothetical protein [Bacteroidia bacterium]